jgi:prepilin-type N-terminal cleavage/methylation domain-containing protein
MLRPTPRAVAGMTLVELLVVVAIIGLLAVTVLPNLAGADGQREVRLAAATVSSHVTRGPALAIEQRRSAGIWLEPLASNPWACIDLYSTVVPPAYRGDSFDAAFEVTAHDSNPMSADLNPNPVTGTASLIPPATSTLGNFTQSGNLIQFGDAGPLFDLQFNGGWKAMLRAAAGQTPANTIWPAPPPAVHPFAIHRLPMRFGQPLVVGGGAAIDLFWSGMGSTLFSSDQRYVAAGGGSVNPALPPARISLLWDASGSLAELCFLSATSAPTARIPVTGPVYLLVGRVERCGQGYVATPTKQSPGANWQSPDAFWIGIDPQSGIVKVTEVKPSATTVFDSQEYIRAGLSAVRL